MNLMNNAIEAVQFNSINPEISIHARIKEKFHSTYENQLEIIISDNGNGMPLSIQEKIFQPFFTTKTQGENLGLGLSVVKNIIDNSNGSIKVESEIGKGSTFSVNFPIKALK